MSSGPLLGVTTLPVVTAVWPISPAIGAADLGVAEVDPRRAQIGLRGQQQGRVALLGRDRIVVGRALAGRGAEQRLRAVERNRRVRELGVGLRHRRRLGLHVGLERRLFQHIEKLALLDLGALGELALFEEGGDARDQRDAIDGLDAADERIGLGDRAALGAHHADRRRRRRAGRPGGTGAGREGQKGERRQSGEARTHEPSFTG